MRWTSSQLSRGKQFALGEKSGNLELEPHQPLSEQFPRESERFKDFRPEVFWKERTGKKFAVNRGNFEDHGEL